MQPTYALRLICHKCADHRQADHVLLLPHILPFGSGRRLRNRSWSVPERRMTVRRANPRTAERCQVIRRCTQCAHYSACASAKKPVFLPVISSRAASPATGPPPLRKKKPRSRLVHSILRGSCLKSHEADDQALRRIIAEKPASPPASASSEPGSGTTSTSISFTRLATKAALKLSVSRGCPGSQGST